MEYSKSSEIMCRLSRGCKGILSYPKSTGKRLARSLRTSLPPGAPLGTYFISARNQQVYFDVQEQPAQHLKHNKSDKDEYLAGDTATISASGKYYFGVPLDGTLITAYVTEFYFDRYSDEYFSFGSSW
jgi:uncharacterized protein YfaS (alpha-2-macroglobulin family)